MSIDSLLIHSKSSGTSQSRRVRRLLQARVTGKAIPEVHREPCAGKKDWDQYRKNTMYAPRSFLSEESSRFKKVIVSPHSEAIRNEKCEMRSEE